MSTPEERLSEFYELRAREEPPHDPEAQLRFAKALAAAGSRPGDRLLDVGAKWGGLGEHARRAGWDIDYTGLELNERHVSAATDMGLDVRLCDVGRPLPVPDAGFDAVVCLELLEHLMAPLALLGEMRRVLKPDGRAIVSVPNPYSWVEVYRELRHRPDPEGHLNGFTTPVMENVLALAGFRVERRLGTSVRIPRTRRIVATDSILARSRIYVARPSDRLVFAGREL
jgi:SAM-dependent methyltransferase